MEGKLPQISRHLRAPPSLNSIKYTKMQHFEKKLKMFSPEGPRDCENVSLGPAVALYHQSDYHTN